MLYFRNREMEVRYGGGSNPSAVHVVVKGEKIKSYHSVFDCKTGWYGCYLSLSFWKIQGRAKLLVFPTIFFSVRLKEPREKVRER